MKKSKIIFLIIFLAATAAVLYFAYGVARNRYFAQPKNTIESNDAGSQNTAPSENQNTANDQSTSSQENTSSDIGATPPQAGRPNVANSDCDKNCANFKDNPDNLKYCQEVCGLRPTSSKEKDSQCESLTGLDKNACWRDLAVSKKDIAICDKISDAKLKKVCRNRVTEEVLN